MVERCNWRLLLGLLLVSLFLPLAYSADWYCAPYDGSAPLCNMTVGTMIAISGNPVPHNQFYSVIRGRMFLAMLRIPESCLAVAIEMICVSHLRPCLELDNTTHNGTGVYPPAPCLGLCERFVNACKGYFEAGGVPLWAFSFSIPPAAWNESAPCVQPDPLYGAEYPYFQPASTNYSINGTGTYADVPCLDMGIDLLPAECTPPLVHEGPNYCSFLCPLPSLTDSEYNSAKIMQAIVSWLSWALSSIMIISYLVNPQLRAFPKSLLIATALGSNILAGGMVLPTFAGYNNIWCGGDSTTITPETYFYFQGYNGELGVRDSLDILTAYTPACSLQGAILLFGFLACAFWWAITAFNMCLEIYFGKWLLRKKNWKWIRIVAYTLIGWGIPFLFMLIPASAGKLGFEPASTFCFITTTDNYAWILTFFFIPVGLCLLFGSVLFILSLVKLTWIAIRVKKTKEVIVPYVRVSLFVLAFFLVICLFGAYVINDAVNQGTISSGYSAYYQCLSGTTFTPADQCQLNGNVSNYNLVMLKGFAISCLGALLFFIFFFSPAVFIHWYRIIIAIGKLLATRDRKSAMAVFEMVGWRSSASSSLSGASSLTMVPTQTVGNIEEEEEDEKSGSGETEDDHDDQKEDEKESSFSPEEEDN